MGSHHRRWTVVSALAAAAVVVAAGAVWGLGVGSEPAAASGTDGQYCTSTQVTASMPFGDRRGPVAHDAIVLTPKPGETCFLAGAPHATLQTAHGLRVVSDPGYGPRVKLSASSPVYIPVSWPDEGSASAQAVPRSITLEMPGTGELVVAWGGGGVDMLDGSDPVRVSAARPGPIPAAYDGHG